MCVDVFVLMVFVGGELEGGDFGDDVVGEACGDEEIDALFGVVAGDEFVEFGGDAFGADAVDFLGHGGHGLVDAWGDGESELGGEACCAKHA